jgi:hypothetical protein
MKTLKRIDYYIGDRPWLTNLIGLLVLYGIIVTVQWLGK